MNFNLIIEGRTRIMIKNAFALVFVSVCFIFAFSTAAFGSDSSPETLSEQAACESGDFYQQCSIGSGEPFLLFAQASSAEQDDDAFDESLEDEFETEETEPVTISDPLYYFNYAMYSFNDVFYLGLLEPIAKGYKQITPTPVRKGVRNFFHNLLFPVRFVNNILQGELTDATKEIGIFIVNSTVGVAGLLQPAQDALDLQTADEDLGQTLGKYSIGNGFYLVLPILGPSSLRDTIGLVGDSFLKPVNYVEPWELSVGIQAFDAVNRTSFRIGDYQALKDAAVDPYVAIRDAYIQNRNEQIRE